MDSLGGWQMLGLSVTIIIFCWFHRTMKLQWNETCAKSFFYEYITFNWVIGIEIENWKESWTEMSGSSTVRFRILTSDFSATNMYDQPRLHKLVCRLGDICPKNLLRFDIMQCIKKHCNCIVSLSLSYKVEKTINLMKCLPATWYVFLKRSFFGFSLL